MTRLWMRGCVLQGVGDEEAVVDARRCLDVRWLLAHHSATKHWHAVAG